MPDIRKDSEGHGDLRDYLCIRRQNFDPHEDLTFDRELDSEVSASALWDCRTRQPGPKRLPMAKVARITIAHGSVPVYSHTLFVRRQSD